MACSLLFSLSFFGTAQAGVLSTLSSILGTPKETPLVPEAKQSADVSDLLRPTSLSQMDEKATSSQDTFSENFSSDGAAASVTSGPLRLSTEDEIFIPESDLISSYTVREGDTLEAIAKMFKVSVNTIMWANSLSSKKIKAGEDLVILPVSGVIYTIKKGDTLKNIAKKYKGDAQDIAFFNGITLDTVLTVGDTVIIPDGEMVDTTAKTSTGKTISQVTKKIVSGLPTYDGYFIRPIIGGRRTTGLHGHNAVDLAAKSGTQIMAAAAGKVIVSKQNGAWNGGYGNYVVISHPNGTQTLYAHNSSNLVSVGDMVQQGQVIALMGSTGKSTGSHVHFEIHGAKNPF
jgi:LysM repeat protein